MRQQMIECPCPDSQLQRLHVAYPDSWEALNFLSPAPDKRAFHSFVHVYRRFLVPACPWIFGNLVLFRLPPELQADLPVHSPYGVLGDRLTAACALLRRGVSIRGGKPTFREEAARKLWLALEAQGCVDVVRGKLPTTQFIPVGEHCGYLSENYPDARLKVNASFFIMDPIDCATVFDHIGQPLGLRVKDGVIQSPPLFGREALLVRKDGSVEVRPVHLEDLGISIGGTLYRHGVNATIHSRPRRKHLGRSRDTYLVIVGDRVVCVGQKTSVPIPASGFVLQVSPECPVRPGAQVSYVGLEDVAFGIQVGNSILRDGVPTREFISKFYNIYHLEPVPYPPSLYPMDFEHARAARIALGADRAGNPMVLWAEGASKLGYDPGTDSRGASLSDMARYCAQVGMHNAVNLDGGGSAQMLINNKRSLRISDRDPESKQDTERPIPMGLMME